MAISYIGADVDCKMTEFAVEKNGKITDRDRVPTDIRSMSNFLSSISGRKIMTVEEGPMAGWLYRNLKSKVDDFIVCDPRRNKLICCDGDKDDAIDAKALAMLLRGGFLREVYLQTTKSGWLSRKQWLCIMIVCRIRFVRSIN